MQPKKRPTNPPMSEAALHRSSACNISEPRVKILYAKLRLHDDSRAEAASMAMPHSESGHGLRSYFSYFCPSPTEYSTSH